MYLDIHGVVALFGLLVGLLVSKALSKAISQLFTLWILLSRNPLDGLSLVCRVPSTYVSRQIPTTEDITLPTFQLGSHCMLEWVRTLLLYFQIIESVIKSSCLWSSRIWNTKTTLEIILDRIYKSLQRWQIQFDGCKFFLRVMSNICKIQTFWSYLKRTYDRNYPRDQPFRNQNKF